MQSQCVDNSEESDEYRVRYEDNSKECGRCLEKHLEQRRGPRICEEQWAYNGTVWGHWFQIRRPEGITSDREAPSAWCMVWCVDCVRLGGAGEMVQGRRTLDILPRARV
jgi:hypothetical protein